MRRKALAVAAVAALALVACRGKDTRMSSGLANDLASASQANDITLAPVNGSQTVVSAVERIPEARTHVAPSSRAARMVARHRAPERARVTPRQSTQVAAATAPAPAPSPVPQPAPATTTASAASPNDGIIATDRPHQVDVPAPSRGDGSGVGNGGMGGLGSVIGSIGIAILRGGVVDGDHCDPRGEGEMGRRRGGISINARMPGVPGGGIF